MDARTYAELAIRDGGCRCTELGEPDQFCGQHGDDFSRTHDALARAVLAVLDIHKPDDQSYYCAACDEVNVVSGELGIWPCPTVRAINAALGTEEEP